MNIFLNEYFGFCFELNFELNHFSARFNEKMNFQNISNRAIHEHEARQLVLIDLRSSGLVGISFTAVTRPPGAIEGLRWNKY